MKLSLFVMMTSVFFATPSFALEGKREPAEVRYVDGERVFPPAEVTTGNNAQASPAQGSVRERTMQHEPSGRGRY